MSDVTAETAPTIPVPPPSAVSQPFWTATGEGRLIMQRCRACQRLVWYPRYVCPGCGATELMWEELSGRGTVYAASIHHRPALPALTDRVPYTVLLVDLVEGARIMSTAFDAPPAVGDEVVLRWLPLGDGRQLPIFERN